MREEVAKIVVELEKMQHRLFVVSQEATQMKNRSKIQDASIKLLLVTSILKKTLGGDK